jgi:hypothetical protein
MLGSNSCIVSKNSPPNANARMVGLGEDRVNAQGAQYLLLIPM